MKNKTFRWFYTLSLLGVIAASYWPLMMGVRVVRDMIVQGTVMGKDYPKYVIPYLPISLAVIIGVALMPLLIGYCRKYALLAASGAGLGVFFASELVLENWVIVTDTVMAKLESLDYNGPWMYEVSLEPAPNRRTGPVLTLEDLVENFKWLKTL